MLVNVKRKLAQTVYELSLSRPHCVDCKPGMYIVN